MYHLILFFLHFFIVDAKIDHLLNIMKIKRSALSLFFMLPLPLIWLLVYLAPFGSPHQKVISLFTLVPILFLSALHLKFSWSLLQETHTNKAWVLLILFGVISFCTSVFAGFSIHEDYFSYFSMALFQMIILVFLRFDTLFPELQLSENRTKVYFLGLLLLAIFTLWIILMGFALVTRQEPRWWESFIYNLYNMGLAGVLVFATLEVAKLPKRIVQTSKLSLIVDDLDFTQVLGPGGCLAAWYLLVHREPVTCSRITQKSGQLSCLTCHEEKAQRCPIFIELFNQMRMVRRLLEALRLGIVRGPDERKNIPLLQGWVFLKNGELEVMDLESIGKAENH